ncbi:MAG: chromosome partitioning protein ParA, partial [Rikenellaceae bacterium]
LDLDIRKGTLSKAAHIRAHQVGVSQYLSGKIADVNKIIRPFAKDIPFDIISSGVLPPNPAELLKGDLLAKIIGELREKYDYIIIDNPPYGVVVDAAICARLCDQSIYVVRAGRFDKRFLGDIQELYDLQKLPNMSVLLNGVDCKINGYGYGYGDSEESNKPWYKHLLGLFSK